MSTNVKAKVNPDVETLDAQDESEVIRYELMVIVTPDVSQADYEKHVEEVKALLNAHHAQVEHTEDWGKRDLAYSIKRKTNGYYYVLDFKMDPAEAPELNKQLRITPFVLRYLVVKLSEDYVPQKYDLETPKRPEYKPEAQKTQAHKPRAAAPARAAAKEARSGSADPSAGFGGM